MKTTKAAVETGAIPPTLIRSVIRQVGRESLDDIVHYGIDGGFPGFTYYRDTSAFFRRHRAAIVAVAEAMADALGEDPVEMVAGFRCINDAPDTRRSIRRCLYGGRLTDDDTQVENALAWFAAEEVARLIVED